MGIRVLPPGTACTETYLVANRFDEEKSARRFADYLRTKFVRFLISVRTNTHHLYSERFAFVPDLPMDRTWTDKELYDLYGLSTDEIDYIEASMRHVEFGDA
jgi:site-specific DNA-methyltransferase (adenine-specific)